MYLKATLLFAFYITNLCDLSVVGHNVIPYHKSYPNECDADPSEKLKDCRDINGKSVDRSETNILPSNTSCTLMSHDSNQTVQVICRDGIFVTYLPHEKTLKGIDRLTRDATKFTKIGKLRKVRSFGTLTEEGAKIGNLFGPLGAVIGGGIGLVADIFCLIFCSNKQPPPNKPPTITKQAALLTATPIYAKNGTTKATVTWEAPTVSDPENGNIMVVASPSNFKSGIEFPEGSYVVYFVGTDNGGLSVTTYIFFEVKVYRCGFPKWPENGYIDCKSSDIIFGTKCQIICKSGYNFGPNDTDSLTCGKHGAWTPAYIPDCKPIDCESAAQIQYGEIQCLNNKAEYDNICEAVCNAGFQVRGMRLMGCDNEGKWGPEPECKDVEPPRFLDCPDNIQVYIDSPNNTAMVSWDEPKGQDNSEENITILEIHGYKPGQRLETGSYAIQYTIEDNESNQGDSCLFSLKVLSLSCSPPDLGEHLKYDCPDSYKLGAECSLACKSGYPKAGEDIITCLREPDTYPPALEWKWEEGGLAPFCKRTNCSMDVLNKPINGALACSEWTHGQMCQLQCNAKYDIPSFSDGLYVCGMSTGLWRPSSYVPDCNRKFDVNNSHLPNEFFYYTGECNSSTENLNEIKENFVQALNTSDLFEACVGVPECQAKFVDVTCGPVTSRRKRSLNTNALRRSPSRKAYRLTFDLILSYKEEIGKTPNEKFAEHENILYEMSEKIRAEADSGHFNINIGDLFVDTDSYGPGYVSWQCPAGMVPRTESASCAGCPKGHYSTTSGRCIECPLGTYQNSTNSLKCEPCPSNTNTTETRSENITQCLEYCKAGEFSPNRLAPCTKCPSNSFQSSTKSESCIRCEINQRTVGDGATAKSQCQDFDVQISTNNARIRGKVTLDVVTFFMWIYISNAKTDAALDITKSVPDSGLSLRLSPAIEVTQSGITIETGHTLPTSSWTSLALSIDKPSEEIKLYINGEVLYENLTFNITSSHALEENDLIRLHGDMKISAFSTLPRKAFPSEIGSWSSTCSPTINGTVLSTDDLAEAENVRVVVPSVCYAVNLCKESPCGTHICINRLGDYECLCSDGFTGRQCEIPPDFCENNNCKNGATCVNGTANYTCQCLYGYSGVLCEIKAVDGQWSGWSSLTACSKSCGGGVASRVRRCDSPPPDPEGQNCVGSSNETMSCKEEKCPECLKLRRTYGAVVSCNETSEMLRCVVSCKPGMYFGTTPLPYYQCGVATGYKWNHQNENNTKARLPACSETLPAVHLGVEYEGVYSKIPCTTNTKKQVKASLESKMSSLDCRMTDACQTTVKEPICSNESRKKRTTESFMTVTIALGADTHSTEGDFNVHELLNKNSTEPTPELIAFVNQTLVLEKSAQILLNNSVDYFQVTVDGTNYTLSDDGSSSLTYKSTSKCPSGTVRIDVFCAESPIGSYADGETVIMCAVGQYQDETRQSSCKQCPKGKTTDGIGSINVSECSVADIDRDDNDKDKDVIDDAVKIGVGVTAALLLLTLAVVAVILTCKHLNKKRYRTDVSNIDLNAIEVFNMPGKPLYGKHMQQN